MLGSGMTNRSIRCLLTAVFLCLVAAPLRAELLLFYTFDDDSDPLVALDQSGQGNDGVLTSNNDFDADGVPDTPPTYTDPGLGRTGAGDDRALDFHTTAEASYINVPNAVTGAFDT